MTEMISTSFWNNAGNLVASNGWLFWLLGFVCTLVIAVRDQPEIMREIRAASGRKKIGPVCNLSLHWLAAAVTGLGALGSQIGSDKLDASLPENQPVRSVAASARFKISRVATNFVELDTGPNRKASLSFARRGEHPGVMALFLTADRFSRFGDEYFVEFVWDSLTHRVTGSKTNLTAGQLMSDLRECFLSIHFLPEFRHVGGKVTLTLNATVQKEFVLVPNDDGSFWMVTVGWAPGEQAKAQ